MIEIGKVNDLILIDETESGYYLKDLNSDDEVFMPPPLAPLKMDKNQEMKAFVYLDSKGGIIATSDMPYAQVGEYALMRAVDVQEFGAFFDWGIEKDLLVPGNEQKFKVRNHEDHLVRICLEEGTDRVYGTTKLGKYIEASEFDFAETDKVQVVPVQETDLGYRVIVNKKFIGLIYHNEIFTKIVIGKTYEGHVKLLRVDGLVDVALQVQGIKNLDNSRDQILNMLKEGNGKSSLNDKSAPIEIKNVFGMSKNSF